MMPTMTNTISFGSKTVFSNSLKIMLSTALAAGSLCSCSFVEKHTSPETYKMLTFNDDGVAEANLAVVAFSSGNLDEADKHVLEALHDNKKNANALLVGALLSEKTGRPNRARQYYEEILLYNGNDVSMLGAMGSEPEKITDIARRRLRTLNLSQNQLIVEDKDGTKVFNVSGEASVQNGMTALEEALFQREKTQTGKTQAEAEADRKAVEILFNDGEMNTVSRFIILKELAENDMITKEEFLRARQANIGGLLPLTHTPPAASSVKPVPTAAVIVDRINALKSAVEDRAITPKEFSAERNLIIEAVLPTQPTARLRNKAPAKDILSAAKDLRKLEVIYDLNLITSSEKEKEQKAIEKSLGLGGKTVEQPAPQQQQPASVTVNVQTIQQPSQAQQETPAQDNVVVETQTSIVPANYPTNNEQPLLPNVSSPFNK